MRRVVAVPPQVTGEAEVVPTRAEAYARRQRERAEGHARIEYAMRQLAAAIHVGDDSYRRLDQRLDDYDTRLEAVRSGLRTIRRSGP